MIQKFSIQFRAIALMIGFLAVLSSCKKDKQDLDLTLDKNTLEMFVDDQSTVNISSGNGSYSVTSSAEAVATATLSGQTVSISAKSKGNTSITVKDGAGRTAVITVTVKSAIIDATTQRFKWTSTVELNKANGWAAALLNGKVALTHIADKKQYVLSWTGGYTVGDKTEAKLRIVESGKTTEEITLKGLEVQKAENNLYSIVFNNDAQKGELVISK